ncbi:alpha/beta hydrolase [Leptospira koniambonensis]|uniref:alpha/beta hydrolase n=1 Tax=Leptospira koniambonensis TaxID=2484950 RepID=UPI003EBAC776
MKNIYLISGLGADGRVFDKIDFKAEKPKHISWIDPINGESLANYSKRLLEQIDLSQEVILIGVSFGGIIAVEIAKHIRTKQIIIISSIKTSSERPYFYNLISFLKIVNLIPAFLLKLYTPILSYYFGISSGEDKILLKDFLRNTKGSFVKWALKSILNWKNKEYPKNLIHIHGTKDKLFPYRLIEKPVPIEQGGHFMVLNKFAEISIELSTILNTSSQNTNNA